MYLLYLDDSGSVKNASDTHIILAGVSVFERRPHWFSGRLDEIAARVRPEAPQEIEFRGTDIRGGKKYWRRIPKDKRYDIYREALQIVAGAHSATVFGAAIHKSAISPDDPMEYAFEQICNRFDRYLGRLHKSGNTQRGLIVLDKSSDETALQGLARDFRIAGHRWGQLHNLADVPLFVDSKATRMIQLADLIAHAIRRYYENGDADFFDVFSSKFDAVGGVIHGLVHYTPSGAECNCLACR